MAAHELSLGYPQTLVLDTVTDVKLFWQAIGGPNRLPADDFREILTQIVAALLNSTPREEELLLSLPDFNRLIGGHGIETAVLQQAVQNLGFAIRDQLLRIGAYADEGCPYILDSVMGCDIVLRLLPY